MTEASVRHPSSVIWPLSKASVIRNALLSAKSAKSAVKFRSTCPAAFDRQIGKDPNETTKRTKNTKSDRVMIRLVSTSAFNIWCSTFRVRRSAFNVRIFQTADPGLGIISQSAPAGAMDLSESTDSSAKIPANHETDEKHEK